MQSNLRQHITTMVRDIIPLDGSACHRACNKGKTYPVPGFSSQETNEKDAHTLKPLNPLLQTRPPHRPSGLERRNRSILTFPSGSKKVSARGQERLSSYNVPMRKVQFNYSHLNNNGSSHSAGKKDVPFQRQGSYKEQKEFALAFCKQLTENLKVGRPVLQTDNNPHKMPSVQPPPASSSVTGSHKASASLNSQRRLSLDSSMNQQSQKSVEKISSSLSQGDRMHHQATTSDGRSLSMKRVRESSTERDREGKRLCQEEVGLMPSTTCGRTSQFSSSPKFIKRAFMKMSNEQVLSLSEKCTPKVNNHTEDRIKASNNVAKQLFQEPRTESHKLQKTSLSTEVLDAGDTKEEMRESAENQCLTENTAAAEPCPFLQLSSRLNQSQEEGDFTVSLHTSSLPELVVKIENSCPLQQPKVNSPGSLDISQISKTITKAKKVEEKTDLVWNDPLYLDLGEEVGLESCALSLSSSNSNEEDHLLSFQEILECRTHVCITPEKLTFSEPSTPDLKIAPMDLKSKTTTYKNTLDQMLKEKEQNRKVKELEMQLLQSCKEDLLKLDEEEENAEEGLSHEQREFLQRFSVTMCVIRDIHPGEEVFTLTSSGRLFNHQSLDLRKMNITPNNRAQQTLLQAHSGQLLPLLSAGLFRRAYSFSPCQPQVTCWLFQMMSVHPNPIVCAQILQAMTSIASSAAQQIVEKSSKKFEVWVPSIQDIAVVFLNMGVSFVSLFPLESLQPPFTEGDLLEGLEIQPNGPTSEKEGDTFPEHNFESIIKYLAICTALCPRVYSDEELLLLLTVVCRISLETRLQLLPTGDLSCLLQHLLNNMTHWETQLSQVCQAIASLSEDHHNLRRLVQLLPHSGRGKQLRRHVSVSVISKLLNHRCTYIPSCTEFQLSNLRCYLPRMRPSLLLKGIMAAKTREQETDDCATNLDQQAYYLCYSLLALTNEASNFEFLPSNQRKPLQLLSAELEKHVKCDIRESEKMLYRSKVKDFVARIYTKWQVLLQRSRPQEGIYDQWQPLPEDQMPTKSQFTEQEDAGESLSEESDIDEDKSDEDMCLEEKDEIPVESEETHEKTELQVSGYIKEKLSLITLNDSDTDETKENMATDEELLGGSSEQSVESDEDEDLIIREELLKDDELDRNGDLVNSINDEPEKPEFLEKHEDILEKTNELFLD